VLTRVNQELRTEIADRQRAEEQLRTSLDQLRALADRLQTVRERSVLSISRKSMTNSDKLARLLRWIWRS